MTQAVVKNRGDEQSSSELTATGQAAERIYDYCFPLFVSMTFGMMTARDKDVRCDPSRVQLSIARAPIQPDVFLL